MAMAPLFGTCFANIIDYEVEDSLFSNLLDGFRSKIMTISVPSLKLVTCQFLVSLSKPKSKDRYLNENLKFHKTSVKLISLERA